jgi:tripartite-type tricarboxylate transporter receptor subunit TctC
MKLMTWVAKFAVAALLFCELFLESAAAQNFPTRTIRVITAVSAGGTYDVFVRTLAAELHKRGGQPVIVEPRPGANEMIGGRACAEAAPDGYTICALSPESLYPELFNRTVPYNSQRDFVPITNLFFNTQALVVNSTLGVSTLEELASLVKAKPNKLAYTAPALPQQAFMEAFNRKYGTDLINVPFRGGAEGVNNLLSGVVPIAFFGAANFLPYVQAGKVVALAVDSETRSPLYPNVPTLKELGYRVDLPRNYLGLVVPAGTPESVIEWVRNMTAEIMSDADFRKINLLNRGLEPIADSSASFREFLAKDRARFETVVRETGFQRR